MNCIVHKWTEEENAELMCLHEKGVKNNKLAIVFKTTPGNIAWRIWELKKKAAQEKPKERTIVDLLDDEYCSVDTGETYDDICRVIADVSGSIEPESKTVNAKIASLCDTPDPQRELDPIDEAAISMKQAAFEEGPKPVACEPTIFDRAHGIIALLRQAAEDQLIDIGNIDIAISNLSVDAFASNAGGESVEIHKKYQPVTELARKGITKLLDKLNQPTVCETAEAVEDDTDMLHRRSRMEIQSNAWYFGPADI